MSGKSAVATEGPEPAREPASIPMKIVRVALDIPLPRLFDYRSVEATPADIGCRVLVPFGKRHVVGVIVGIAARSELAEGRLRQVERIIRDVPPLSTEWLNLAKFCSDYYHRPLGEVVMTALPPRLRSARPVPREPESYAITAAGTSRLAEILRGKTRIGAILSRLAQSNASAADLAGVARGARSLLTRCLEAGWIETVEPGASNPRFIPGHRLTSEQDSALAALSRGLSGFRVSLLFGVTGSGKTEVYLQLIAEALSRGKQALVLVPEIALTPALETLFRNRFPGACLAIQTSAMPQLERTHGWLRAQRGRADIVLGTRLGVYTPMPKLGLIVVDEEQDASFKQQDGLRYSARDLAIVRARAAGVPVLLSSATPALETYRRALAGKYELIRLTRRAIERAELPAIRLIDTRKHPLQDGLAAPIMEALGERLARSEQSLVFLNRRGYAPALACPACGWVKDCERCSAHMVVHLAERTLRCHHCGLAADIPRACPQCGNLDLQTFGRGTQRVEATLVARLPNARILRLDSDAIRGRGKLEDLLRHAERADILVGTQILAKGHHFERLTLACVLNADSGLFSSDYRGSEKAFALLQQVAGRPGRASLAGEVLIQTRYPDHALYRSLANHDFPGFASELLAERRAAGFPPFAFEAALRAESQDLNDTLRFLKSAIEHAPEASPAVTVFEPAPMSLVRLAGMERAQVLVQSGSRPRLQAFLREWTAALYQMRAHGVRWHVDVDPTEF